MSDELDGQVIHREFAADLEATGDGRTLDVRVVPYNVVARVADPPDFTPYDEMWMPGVFSHQKNAANRVLVNFEHEQGVGGVVGRGQELRDSDDAMEGSFRMLSAQDADKALELVREGVLGGVSLEAKPIKSVRTEDGVVQRVKAHLVNIALCRSPAFEGAQVLAVREQAEIKVSMPNYVGSKDELMAALAAQRPYKPNDELRERLARLGIEPLVSRKTSESPWNPVRERFEDDQWERSCLIPDKLPVLEPDGTINLDAIRRAAREVAGGRIVLDPSVKGAAARKLIRYFDAAKLDVPDNLRNVARWL